MPGCHCRSLPGQRRRLAGLLLHAGVFGLALRLHGLDALLVGLALRRRHIVVGLSAPARLQATAPAPEGPGGYAIVVHQIPP